MHNLKKSLELTYKYFELVYQLCCKMCQCQISMNISELLRSFSINLGQVIIFISLKKKNLKTLTLLQYSDVRTFNFYRILYTLRATGAVDVLTFTIFFLF